MYKRALKGILSVFNILERDTFPLRVLFCSQQKHYAVYTVYTMAVKIEEGKYTDSINRMVSSVNNSLPFWIYLQEMLGSVGEM